VIFNFTLKISRNNIDPKWGGITKPLFNDRHEKQISIVLVVILVSVLLNERKSSLNQWDLHNTYTKES